MGAPQSVVLKDLKDKLIYIQNRMVMLQEIRSGYETYKEEKAAEKKIQDMREAGKEEAAKIRRNANTRAGSTRAPDSRGPGSSHGSNSFFSARGSSRLSTTNVRE